MAGNGEMIIELDQKRMTAMAQKDTAALKNMLCKGLVYTHSSGRQDTKQSLMDGMESGTTVYTSIVPSEVKAQDLGNAVVLTGVAAISVNSNGKPNAFRVRFTESERHLADDSLAVDKATRVALTRLLSSSALKSSEPHRFFRCAAANSG